MNRKILETLEFNKVKALFEPHLLTEQGLEQLRQLAPTAKADKIKQAFAEMKEMQALFIEQPHFTILATKEIAGVCKRLEMGADLNIEEFLLLKRVLLSSRELQSFYANLENVSLEELAYGLRNYMIFLNYKEISKPLMMRVLLKILPVKNWRASVEKSMIARVRYAMFYRTCSSKKRRC